MKHNAPKAYRGMGMDGIFAHWYAALTRRDLAQLRDLAVKLGDHFPAGGSVLEVAPGPGYLAIELAKLRRAASITGVDISQTCVDIAQRNAREEGVAVHPQQGNASDLPFADNAFDLIVCRAAFKNFSQPIEALQEIHRTLKPAGEALIIDLRRDVSPEAINELASGHGWLNRRFVKAIFKYMLIKRAYTQHEMEELARQAGFGSIQIDTNLVSLEIWLRK